MIAERVTTAQHEDGRAAGDVPAGRGLGGGLQRQEAVLRGVLPLHVLPHARHHLPRRSQTKTVQTHREYTNDAFYVLFRLKFLSKFLES